MHLSPLQSDELAIRQSRAQRTISLMELPVVSLQSEMFIVEMIRNTSRQVETPPRGTNPASGFRFEVNVFVVWEMEDSLEEEGREGGREGWPMNNLKYKIRVILSFNSVVSPYTRFSRLCAFYRPTIAGCDSCTSRAAQKVLLQRPSRNERSCRCVASTVWWWWWWCH